MRNSGCEVPDYMLSLKKVNRDERKKLAQKAPKRDAISRVSKYEKEQTKKKGEIIAASKKRKSEGKVRNPKKKKKVGIREENEVDDFDEEIESDFE